MVRNHHYHLQDSQRGGSWTRTKRKKFHIFAVAGLEDDGKKLSKNTNSSIVFVEKEHASTVDVTNRTVCAQSTFMLILEHTSSSAQATTEFSGGILSKITATFRAPELTNYLYVTNNVGLHSDYFFTSFLTVLVLSKLVTPV